MVWKQVATKLIESQKLITNNKGFASYFIQHFRSAVAYLSSLAPDNGTPSAAEVEVISDLLSIRVSSAESVADSGGRGDCDSTGEYVGDLSAVAGLTPAFEKISKMNNSQVTMTVNSQHLLPPNNNM